MEYRKVLTEYYTVIIANISNVNDLKKHDNMAKRPPEATRLVRERPPHEIQKTSKEDRTGNNQLRFDLKQSIGIFFQNRTESKVLVLGKEL